MAAEVTGQLAYIGDIAKLASHGRWAFAEFNKIVEKVLCQQPV